MSELIITQEINPMVIFSEQEEMDKIIGDIKQKVSEFKPDMSTASGRKEIASFAYKIAQSKTFLDKSGKDLTEQAREKIKLINNERNRVVELLQELQDQVRKPLTDWENAEKERIAGHENAINQIVGYKSDYPIEKSQQVNDLIVGLDEFFHSREWQEFKDRAQDCFNGVKSFLQDRSSMLAKQEEEREELERLRKEAAEREQKEREERIAKEAAERARLEAEAKAKAEREEVERKAREEKEAAERARLEAEAKAKEAVEKAKIAAQKERERIEFQKQLEDKEAKKREADKKHKSAIHNMALTAFVNAGLPEEKAKIAVTEIAKGNIPNIKITY